MTKDELIDILEKNKENIKDGDWDTVYENIHKYKRGEFSQFLLENDIDPSIMFEDVIPEFAFQYCRGLTTITIPNSVTSIGCHAFRDCKSLTSITIPNSVKYIDYSAFQSCSSLTSITIPDSVISIGEYVFYKCSSLASITIPSSVKSIGREAFSKCTSLTEIKFDDTEEEWNKVKLGFDWIKDCPAKITFLK